MGNNLTILVKVSGLKQMLYASITIITVKLLAKKNATGDKRNFNFEVITDLPHQVFALNNFAKCAFTKQPYDLI